MSFVIPGSSNRTIGIHFYSIYLAARNRSVEAHWVDPEIGLCLVLSSGPDWIQDETETQNRDTAVLAQHEFLDLVKHVIDDNRTK